MKSKVRYVVPIILIIIFILIMNSGGFLKKPFGKKDNVVKYIEILKKDITNEKWEIANNDLDNLKTAWKIVSRRVQFSVERNEMIDIETSIARIKGNIVAKDKNGAIVEIEELKSHWDELER